MEQNNEIKSNKRKANHCEVERKRRCRINSGYENLKRVMQLPDNLTQGQVVVIVVQKLIDYEEERARKVKIKNDVFMGADVKEDVELEQFTTDMELKLEWNPEWNEYNEFSGWNEYDKLNL